MKKALIVAVAAVALAGASYYLGMSRSSQSGEGAAQAGGAGGGRRGGGAGFPVVAAGSPAGAAVPRWWRARSDDRRTGQGIPEPHSPRKSPSSAISLATRRSRSCRAPPDALQDLSVRLGDRVSRGQRLAKIEDFEIVEQVKQAEAAQEVSQATIRQREADLQLAETSVERSRSLFERQLLPKQTLDDNEARYQASLAQLDLARAQNTQSKARLDELRINLANTVITSPVNGFVAKRDRRSGRVRVAADAGR